MGRKRNQLPSSSGRGEQGDNSVINTLEQYRSKGKQISEKYCVFENKTPIMLPPAPNQKYIDVYLDEEGGPSSEFDNEKRLQANYEAEVIVYRALERLREDILVLHGFEYTHHQYRLCDTSHVRKSCGTCKRNAANREGESDFLIIGKDYFVIIEVKNIPCCKTPIKTLKDFETGTDNFYQKNWKNWDDQENWENTHVEFTKERKELTGAFQKSQKQGEKVKCLIESLIKKKADTEKSLIFHFSAFPSTPRILFHDMDDEQKKQIICEEDCLDFSSWWHANVTDLIMARMAFPWPSDDGLHMTFPWSAYEYDLILNNNMAVLSAIKHKDDGLPMTFPWSAYEYDLNNNMAVLSAIKHKEVKEILIAIWCTDKNVCDEQKCSLGKCIMDIDEELREGKITFPSKNRPLNPNVIKTTEIEAATINNEINIFKDIIGIDNLTAEQCDAFNRDQNLLFINGPAGSGKTIILLAKIIQLIKSNEEENRVVLFIKTSDSNKRYQDTLHEAAIRYKVLEANFRKDSLDTLEQEILDREQNNQVVMVNIATYNDYEIMLQDVLGRLMRRQIHVFVDDCQSVLYELLNSPPEDLLRRFKKSSAIANNRVWIACDLTQMCFYYHSLRNEIAESFIREIPNENRVNLTLNLRNTCDLAGILLTTRNKIVEDYIPETRTADIDFVLPMLQPGHFIHGPKTVLHVINKKHEDNKLTLVSEILYKEIDKLFNTDVPRGFKVGIMNYASGVVTPTKFEKMVKKRFQEFSNKIELCSTPTCYSTEYPAVIVLHDVPDYQTGSLYLEMSRARVYCVVIIFALNMDSVFAASMDTEVFGEGRMFGTRFGETQIKDGPLASLLNLLKELEACIKIIRYD